MNHVILLSMIFCALATTSVRAEVKTETVEYKQGDLTMEGYLAYDASSKDKRPGVLIVHDWKGLGEQSRKTAERLAAMGYVALAVDMYGKGVRPETNEDAGKEAGKLKGDRALLRARITVALETLRANPNVDPKKIAAIGYCFGGTTVLELARSGADVLGVVSFHGGLDNPKPEDAKNIKCKVLVLHGADDKGVNKDVPAFQEEMRAAKIDWRMISYGNAVHSFTNPAAGNDNSKGAAYNELADKRSWEDMKMFFGEIFETK